MQNASQDTRLQQAAPKLLDVARSVVRLWDAFGTYGDPDGDFEHFAHLVEEAKAAIKVATDEKGE